MSYATDFLRFTGIASKYPAGSWFTVAQDHGSYSFAHPTIVRWGIPGNYIAGNLTGAGTVDRSVLGAGTIPSYAGFELQAQDVTFASLNTKLMLIGDSITGFYVNDLSEAITSDAAGFHNVSFIGNNGNPPTDNNGYGGYVTEDLLNPAGTGTKGGSGLYNGDAGDLVNWMAGMAPDLILLHIGTNNSGNATTTISAYTLILNAARARNPGVKFFVSKIIPAAGNPSWSTTLNPMIAAWASANSTTQSPVITVDQYSGFDPSVYDASSNPTGMTRDGTHPTSVYANDTQPKTLTGGYHMAHAALEVLRPYLPSAGGVTLTVGEFVWWPLPAGQVGQIQVQRNGVDIPPVTAVIGGITQTVSPSLSAAQVGAFQYKVAAADIGTLGSPVALTARVIGAAYVTNAPRVYRVEIPLSNPNQIWITYDEGLDSTLPATSDYALAGTMATSKTLTSIALRATAGVYNIVVLTCSSAFVPGDLPLLSYTPGTHPASRPGAHAKQRARVHEHRRLEQLPGAGRAGHPQRIGDELHRGIGRLRQHERRRVLRLRADACLFPAGAPERYQPPGGPQC